MSDGGEKRAIIFVNWTSTWERALACFGSKWPVTQLPTQARPSGVWKWEKVVHHIMQSEKHLQFRALSHNNNAPHPPWWSLSFHYAQWRNNSSPRAHIQILKEREREISISSPPPFPWNICLVCVIFLCSFHDLWDEGKWKKWRLRRSFINYAYFPLAPKTKSGWGGSAGLLVCQEGAEGSREFKICRKNHKAGKWYERKDWAEESCSLSPHVSHHLPFSHLLCQKIKNIGEIWRLTRREGDLSGSEWDEWLAFGVWFGWCQATYQVNEPVDCKTHPKQNFPWSSKKCLQGHPDQLSPRLITTMNLI